ncbi:MAG TPA: TonB family protein [Candidatus Limnocylindrales bacterium]|nr:TonB family protein [Candidatus Limnocylindrales bacterium]
MDYFLEQQVRDAVGKAATQEGDAAVATLRSALAPIDSALALDSRNQTALRLREEVLAAIEAHTPVTVESVAAREETPVRGLQQPTFRMLREGDVPNFEYVPAAERFADRGGRDFGIDPDLQSILDPTPRPQPRNYPAFVAAILAVLFVAVGIRVAWYYLTPHNQVDRASLEARAKYTPVPPGGASDAPVPALADDTIYMAPSGVTLPVLLEKVQPAHVNAQGRVVLLITIDGTGHPAGAKIWQGLNTAANIAAFQAAEKWRFRPGMKDGKPIPVVAQIIFNFE